MDVCRSLRLLLASKVHGLISPKPFPTPYACMPGSLCHHTLLHVVVATNVLSVLNRPFTNFVLQEDKRRVVSADEGQAAKNLHEASLCCLSGKREQKTRKHRGLPFLTALAFRSPRERFQLLYSGERSVPLPLERDTSTRCGEPLPCQILWTSSSAKKSQGKKLRFVICP